MSELEPLANELVLPYTGEVINLDDAREVAETLFAIRLLKSQLDDARLVLEEALRVESERVGSKTLHLGKLDAVVSGGQKVEWDTVELAERLRELGLPEARLAELIREEVSYKVDARVARSVAASNPRYAAAIDECRRAVPDRWRVSLRGRL
jgi:hypothetical protein